MATADKLKKYVTAIADAIRTKEGSTEKINPQDFVQRIENLQVGGGTSESNIEYLDVRGLEDKMTIANYAIMIKTTAMGSITFMTGGLLGQFVALGEDYYKMAIDATTAVAIDGSLEMTDPNTNTLVTIGEFIRGVYGDTFDSIPRITKEQFYSLD